MDGINIPYISTQFYWNVPVCKVSYHMFLCVYFSTLHLAVIHKRTAALRHLLRVLATIPDCQAINMYNDLRQVNK